MTRMLDIRQRSKIRRALYAKPTILLIALAIVFVGQGAWGMYNKSREAKARADDANQKLTELRERSDELSRDIELLSSERGVEEEIRDRFMVAKEGENVMIVADPEEQKVHSITVGDEKPSTLQRILGAIGISGDE